MIATTMLPILGALCGAPLPETTFTCCGEQFRARLVFGDTFQNMQEWTNLTPETDWRTQDGRLVGTWAPGGSTIWSDREFEGDLYIRFRAELLEPREEWRTEDRPDGGKNLNFRFLVTGPGGADIREVYRDLAAQGTGPNRVGDDQYEGYFFTWTWQHARLRRSPGYENISEQRAVLPDLGEPYTVEVLKRGGRIIYAVDGQVIHDYLDPEPHHRGRLGFTLWHSIIAVDFIEVYEVVAQ